MARVLVSTRALSHRHKLRERPPGFDCLYNFTDTGSEREFIAHLDFGPVRDLAVTRGDASISRAAAAWNMGSAVPGDVVWTTSANSVLFSARLAEELVVFMRTGIDDWPTVLLIASGVSLVV